MVDRFSKEKRSKIMSAIRSKDTKPEMDLRRALWAQGFRYRIHYGKEKIDVAFPKKRVAVFIDGCFWHGCPIHGHKPRTNKAYWIPKLEKNKERDLQKNKRLIEEGWQVIRFWEHELENTPKVITKIQFFLNAEKQGYQ